MNRRSILQLSALVGAAALLGGCFGSRVYRWRQKLTITVQTPSGEKSGSAVTEVMGQLVDAIGAGRGAAQAYKGEATIVDLGDGKFLFGLLSEHTNTLAWSVFHDALPADTEGFWGKLETMQGSSVNLPSALYPKLITFDNLQEPKSVREVKPSDLAATFGSGYALKSITLEITDEPVTEGVVEKVLPWISEYFDKMLDGRTIITVKAQNRLANDLAAGNFTTWRHK